MAWAHLSVRHFFGKAVQVVLFEASAKGYQEFGMFGRCSTMNHPVVEVRKTADYSF